MKMKENEVIFLILRPYLHQIALPLEKMLGEQ